MSRASQASQASHAGHIYLYVQLCLTLALTYGTYIHTARPRPLHLPPPASRCDTTSAAAAGAAARSQPYTILYN